MKSDYQHLLQPKILNSISGLALTARVIVDNYLSGFNRSRRTGHGLEFSQYRGYQPGDDPRLMDWKMLARSGRYYIKQSEIDTHIAVKFIIDASASMKHMEKDLSKLDYARILVASLAYLAQNQGDAVGLFSLNDNNICSLYPQTQKQHFDKLLYHLIAMKGKGKWPMNSEQWDKLHDRRHKELIFFITDLYEYSDELSSFIKGLKTSRNEVVVLQLNGKREMEFDFTGVVTFEDLETGDRVKVMASQAREEYLLALKDKFSHYKHAFLAKGISYASFRVDDPMEEALVLFLKRRLMLVR